MDMQLIQQIGPVIVLALFLVFLGDRALLNKEGKADAKKFLETLADKFEGIIVDHLDDIDFKDFHNLAEIEGTILEEIYDEIWKLTLAALEASAQSPFVKMLIKKYLTRETVEAFIKFIFSTDRVQVAYTSKYNQALLSASITNAVAMTVEDIANLEQETVEENQKYETEAVTEDEVTEWANKAIDDYPDGSNSNIVPPVDADEIPVSETDETVEEV